MGSWLYIQARLPTAAVAPGLYSPWYTKPPKRTGAHARVERLTVGAASPISTRPRDLARGHACQEGRAPVIELRWTMG